MAFKSEQLHQSTIRGPNPFDSINEGCSYRDPLNASSGISPGAISLPALEEDIFIQSIWQLLVLPSEKVTTLKLFHFHHELQWWSWLGFDSSARMENGNYCALTH